MHYFEGSGLSEQLKSLYDLNKSYIDLAERFFSNSAEITSNKNEKGELARDDIERLYSHVFVLEHIAKLLYEEFIVNLNRGLPEWPGNDSNRRMSVSE